MSRAPDHPNHDLLVTDATQRIVDVLAGERRHLVVSTSGSTGAAKRVAISGAALRASAVATYERIGGPGQWLLCLPVDHIAGLQVLARSHLAGSPPVVMDRAGSFTEDEFSRAARQLTAERKYVSLVPTQLHRLLADGAGIAALQTFDTILLGGAAAPPTLLQRARAAGLPIVVTYGMTETSGGCVYDGVPLDGVRIQIDPDGRVLLAGTVLADGYLSAAGDLEPLTADAPDGTAGWFRTQDRGQIVAGRLILEGRADDVIICGGENVPLQPVTEAAAALLQARGEHREVQALGVPDDHWGQRVVVAVTGSSPALLQDEFSQAVSEAIRAACGRAATPLAVVQLPRFPTLGSGKYDRLTLGEQVAEILNRTQVS